MKEIAVCTLSSKNFIAHARTMLKSAASQHDNCDYFHLLTDEIEGKFDKNVEPFKIIEAKELGIVNFTEMAFKYDIVEFNVALKPFLINYLFKKGYKKVLYFDADIMVYNKLELIIDLLNKHSIIITPHILSPIPKEGSFHSWERRFLKTGTYNLGFIAISNTSESEKFLDWWSRKCGDECYREEETGLFVDQKWVDLVPGFFKGVFILRHSGCNMGYWNLHERKLNGLIVNNVEPLLFFHFSGLDLENLDQISRYQKVHALNDAADLKEIFNNYKNSVLANGYEEAKHFTYKYGQYDNEVRIGLVARRLYLYACRKYPDPFSTNTGTYYDLLKRKKLLELDNIRPISKDQMQPQLKLLNKILKMLSRLIGINRYSNLMRYMRHAATIRHQKFLLEEGD